MWLPIPNAVQHRITSEFVGPNWDRIGDPETVYIETPTGRPVTALKYANDVIQNEIDESINYVEDLYPNVSLIRNPTVKYNCHSYAWYDTSIFNPYWINSITPYITDPELVEVTSGEAGDIVVYIDEHGYPAHSGIISYRIRDFEGNFEDAKENRVDDLNNIMVTSKRGYHGLYSHIGDDCPYMEFPYLNYYKIKEHEHEFSYEYKDSKKHIVSCDCGYSEELGHVVGDGAFDDGEKYATCLLCGGLASIGFTEVGSFMMTGNYGPLANHFVEETCMIDGILNLSFEDYQYFVGNYYE